MAIWFLASAVIVIWILRPWQTDNEEWFRFSALVSALFLTILLMAIVP